MTNLYNGDCEEDLFLSKSLRSQFNIILSHPLDAEKIEDEVDLILIRNIWPTSYYSLDWACIKERWKRKFIKTYNPLTGLGNNHGKDYLIVLSNFNYPVIKSIDNVTNIEKLPRSSRYVVKSKFGCSSNDVKTVAKYELVNKTLSGYIIQPFIDFKGEVSFYFLDNELVYSMYTPNKNKRWNLKEFNPGESDLNFARRFVNWNNLSYGIQRIDACRLDDGGLLLMEIEDLCPYLSLLDLSENTRNKFLDSLKTSLNDIISRT